MMASMEARSTLMVEGIDDVHTICNLIKKYGIDYKKDPVAPAVEDAKGIDKLLDGIETAVKVSSGRKIGFVIDADDYLSDRWQSVRQRLLSSGVEDVPLDPPAEGFIGDSVRWKSRVGVWLMPDNLSPGALEAFIRSLISEHDSLISHAETSTDIATTLGASFEAKDRLKAVIHSWLAWQKDPGRPYGVAIQARYFNHKSEPAQKFISWYASLFGLQTVMED